MIIAVSLIIGYLCGSFLTADVVAKKVCGKSVFEIGSRNPGMANVMAQIGKKEGMIVLLGDILKTVLAFVLSWFVCGEKLGKTALIYTGAGTILGHNYPAWHRFRGGKGVTVTCTCLILLMPLWGTVSCVAGGVITLLTGYLPLGAVLITLFVFVSSFLFYTRPYRIFSAGALIVMIIAHRRGTMRVLHGTEKRMFRNDA